MPRGKRVPDRRNTDISHVVPRSKRLSNMRRVIISSPTQHIISTSTLCQLTSDDSLLQMWFYVSPGSSARIPPGPGNALRDASYFNANGFCSLLEEPVTQWNVQLAMSPPRPLLNSSLRYVLTHYVCYIFET